MKEKSAKRQIYESLNCLISGKKDKNEKFLLAKDISFVVNGRLYEYEPNTNGLFNQSYYHRIVNAWIRDSMYKQGSNKSFGMPFAEYSPVARVIYIGGY